MKTPLILLTNDDGVHSSYLVIMAEVLEKQLSADVVIVAPEKQRSAMSHSITLHKPLRVDEVRPGVFSVSGTPVDCVYIGIRKLLGRKPDLVVSGPNDGFNLGTDVYYSGTVGAAVEGGLRGVPAIAVSVDHGKSEAVPVAARLTAELAAPILEQKLPPNTILNVNVPIGSARNVRWTELGKRFYQDDVQERKDPRGRSYYWIGGGSAGIAGIPGSDCRVVLQEGVASVTPLHLNWTRHSMIQESPSWELADFTFLP